VEVFVFLLLKLKIEGTFSALRGLTIQVALSTFVQVLLPESPRWLLLSGKTEDVCTEALKKVLGRAALGSSGQETWRIQLEEMIKNLAASSSTMDQNIREQANAASSMPKVLDTPNNVDSPFTARGDGHSNPTSTQLFLQERFRKPLLIGTSLMLYQQVSKPFS
jgi:hypothetical protein